MSKGFTLIELLVVITIMSILTVITVSQFQTARRKARDVQRKADLSSLTKALQLYYADYGAFPEATNGAISGAGWGDSFEDASGYVYMKVMPDEKSSGVNQFCYRVSADLKQYGLYSQLENLQDVEVKPAASCGGGEYNYYIFSANSDGSF